MTVHLVLLAVMFALIVALELLNAYFEGLANLQRAALDEDIEKGRAGSGVGNSMWLGVRIAGAKLVGGLAFVSLYIHELMHAIAQFAAGAKPRIVICKNGGYAEARPWSDSGFAKLIMALGIGLLQGVCGMAPLLGGSVVLFLSVRFLAPLEPGTLVSLADGVATAGPVGLTLTELVGSVSSLVGAIGSAPIWAIGVIVLIAVLLGWGLTPSSADFYNSAPHLLGYLLAYLTAVSFAGSPWLLVAIGAVGAFGYLAVLIKIGPGFIAWIVGGYSLSCGVVGVLAIAGVFGDSTAIGLASALAGLILMLSLATCVYVPFVVVLFLLALFNSPSAAFVHRIQGSQPRTGLLASLVTSFDTCTGCKMHFRGRCDGCGRTIEEIRAAEAT